MFNYLWQCYGSPSKLLFGENEIDSCIGCQQGDPLGPLIFSLAINSVISNLKSNFNLWYLDDDSIGGDASSVFENFQEIIKGFTDIGHTQNFKKCEIFLSGHISSKSREFPLKKFKLLTPDIIERTRES